MSRFLVPALVAFATLSSPATRDVDAASTGRLGYCSLAPTYKYGRGSAVMNWVNAPVFADFYTVRSADTIQPLTSIPTSDPTTYKPGQWTPIHLRVHNLDKKYIGLVIYATNGATDATTGLTNRAGTQVGEWKVTDNLAFWSPDTCGGTALTHSDADIKPLHSVLYWRAPAGTGKVSFHVMIKQGEQGQGNFYYPKFTLSLNEAAATPTPATIMIEAAPKQSCTAACAATSAHKTCDETATAGLSSAAALTTALTGAARSQLICRPQIVSGCISAAPMRQPADLCSFKSTTCAAQGRATAPTTCSATSMRDDLTRLCMCTQTGVVTTAPTTVATAKPTTAATSQPTTAATTKPATTKPTDKATATPTTSAPTSTATDAPAGTTTDAPITTDAPAATSAPTGTGSDGATETPAATEAPTQTPIDLSSTGINLFNAASSRSAQSTLYILLAMCASLFLSGSHRASLLIALIACLCYAVPVADAHNWVMSPSRAFQASVTKPCQARVSPFPHIQVTPGQSFPMEWSVGHSDSRTKTFYWILVKAQDYELLNGVNQMVIEDYIAGAPLNSLWYNSSAWHKRHIGVAAANVAEDPDYMSKYFSGVSTSSDSAHIVRDDIYREKSIFNIKDATRITQWIFKSDMLSDDVRVSYQSTKYPFIISAHRFVNVFTQHTPYSQQANIAQFEIPMGSTPDDYIYHFKWGGYSDCVDVNVKRATQARPTIPLPFGKSAAQALAEADGIAPFVKLDHCEFPFVRNPLTECRIISRMESYNVSKCISDCVATKSCTGVQLIRATNPSTVRIDYTPSIPYYAWNESALDANGNIMEPRYGCEFNSIHEREQHDCRTPHPAKIDNRINPAATCNKAALKPKDDDYICYGLQPYRDHNQQAAEDFVTSDDPEDPVYYSTCWMRIEPGGFVETPRPPPVVPKWTVGDKCMDCAFRDNVVTLPINVAPAWSDSLTNQCRNCDEPSL